MVVDPYVASVLRPHQREGVAFLYECVMGMKNISGMGAILADEMCAARSSSVSRRGRCSLPDRACARRH